MPVPEADSGGGGKGGCGGIGKIFVAVVAVVATYFTAGALAPVLGSQIAGWGVGAMVGSVASQGAGIALGVQDKDVYKRQGL